MFRSRSVPVCMCSWCASASSGTRLLGQGQSHAVCALNVPWLYLIHVCLAKARATLCVLLVRFCYFNTRLLLLVHVRLAGYGAPLRVLSVHFDILTHCYIRLSNQLWSNAMLLQVFSVCKHVRTHARLLACTRTHTGRTQLFDLARAAHACARARTHTHTHTHTHTLTRTHAQTQAVHHRLTSHVLLMCPLRARPLSLPSDQPTGMPSAEVDCYLSDPLGVHQARIVCVSVSPCAQVFLHVCACVCCM
jgi:hypothetical protein